MPRTRLFLWGVIILLSACELGGSGADAGLSWDTATAQSTAAQRFTVSYASIPAPIPLNEPFDLELTLEPAEGAALADTLVVSVDARMPEHGHGMNTTPEVSVREDGTFIVDGMQFHMPGHWELYVDVADDAGTDRATFHIVLEN